MNKYLLKIAETLGSVIEKRVETEDNKKKRALTEPNQVAKPQDKEDSEEE